MSKAISPVSRIVTALSKVCVIAVLCGLGAASIGLDGISPEAKAQGVTSGPSGLPLPRFVSLKSDPVNVRVGPSMSHDVGWRFKQSGLPVEVIAEFDNWRRIRDWEGEEGWVAHQLLSGRRTAIVTPWKRSGRIRAHDKPDAGTAVVALLEPGVMANVERCDGTWCRLVADNWSGWVDQRALWGIYPKETVR